MSGDALCLLTVHELGIRIRDREISPVEILEAHLRRIESLNPKVLGFLNVTAELAREDAKKAEAEIVNGNIRGPLHGIPYGAKDIIDTAGITTTRGSAIFRDNVPARDAHVISRLKEAGAILIGKCHTQEFASGPLSFNPTFGTTRNPWDISRTTGGSSSGSAASVAVRMSPAALGTDTGSSIRGPAALCGIVGLKPTHGRVSLSGICPNALSFDHAGPLTRSARDAALMLQAMAGYDAEDPYSRDVPVPDFSAGLEKGIKDLRIGLCPGLYGNAEVDGEVMEAFERAVEAFRELGAEIKILQFEKARDFLEHSVTILSAEFAEFHAPIYEKHPDGYGEIAKETVESRLGTIHADDLIRAQRKRELFRREVLKLFRETDVIATPSLPCIAPPVDTYIATINGKEVKYDSHITQPFLTPQNYTGCPAITVPMGFSSSGMPVSVQLIGRHWEEAEILRVAHAYEEHTPELRNEIPAI